MKATYLKRGVVFLAALVAALSALFTVGVFWPVDSVAPARTTTPLAIIDVTVVDVQEAKLVPRQTVLVEDGLIVAVGHTADIDVPRAAQVINGSDRFLLPALWDMHTHVYAFSPLLDMPLYIAYGVTNVRDMQGCPQPNDPFIACPEDKRRWTAEAVAAERVGPRIVASTSFMANGPGMLDRMKGLPEFFGTATPEHARAFVRHFAGKVEAIKVYDQIPREAYFALAEEARRLGVEVVGHRPHAVSAIEAAAHQKSIEHAKFILHDSFSGSAELRELAGTPRWREDRRQMLDDHDPQMAEGIFAAMKSEGTWYVPTHLTRWVDAYAEDASVRDDPLLRYLHPLMKWQWLEDVDGTLAKDPWPEARETYREFYRKGLNLTGAAYRSGVKILVGTDYIIAGADVHRELEQLVLAGLTPAAALHAATLAPAEYFGLEEQYGVVAVGKVADLLLLGADPLQDIRNTQRIESVIFNGNLYDRDALDRISNHVQRQVRSWSVACKILWRFIRNPVAY
ncbi:MAG: amidohydrolase family protein [Acidobacteriota bacterium]|nr:amidohydrolase family protein [Acidobacteriota bacterium]